jgi:hypothetical protein
MHAGERKPDLDRLQALPLFRSARRRTLEQLHPHVEHVHFAEGAVVLERGDAVHWIAIPYRGSLRAVDPPGRVWAADDAAGLAEALARDLSRTTVVAAAGGADVALVAVRALTAAVTIDPVIGLAVARLLARSIRPVMLGFAA